MCQQHVLQVAARAAAWIETFGVVRRSPGLAVAARAAAWIETVDGPQPQCASESRLAQPRGLKLRRKPLCHSVTLSRLAQPRGLKREWQTYWYIERLSRLAQPRGLKLPVLREHQADERRRGSRSRVD